jgi:Tfp pilus assembly protein PilF
MSTVLVTGCAGIAANSESVRVLLERSGQSQAKLSPYDQGKRYLQLGSAGLAVSAFEEALKENPDSVPALNGIAVAYDRLGRTDVAQRYLDHALALDSGSPVTLNNLAYLNLVQGNTAVAQAYADRAKIAAALPGHDAAGNDATAVDRTVEMQRLKSEARSVRSRRHLGCLRSDIKRVSERWELRIRPQSGGPVDQSPRATLPAGHRAMAQPVVP